MALPKLESSKYSTQLPSTGENIEYRPYLVKEEKILMIALESKDQKQIISAMKDVVKACVYDDINVNKLTAFDLEWLFLKLRSKSVGEKVIVKLKCNDEECKTLTDVEIDLDEIKVDESVEKEKIIKLNDNVGVTVKYPSVDDISKYSEDKLKTFEGAVEMIVDCIDTIYDEDNVYDAKTEKREDVVGFLESLSSTQFKMISDWFADMPTVSHTVKWDCEGKPQELELRGLQSFFT
tara:strand:+ start:1976 stop:2683 length:708 start_codon:yes stop_codon:yes gene_type:complete